MDKFFMCNPDMMPEKVQICNSLRDRKCVSTMWISKELKLISGGNQKVIEQLNKRLNGRL